MKTLYGYFEHLRYFDANGTLFVQTTKAVTDRAQALAVIYLLDGVLLVFRYIDGEEIQLAAASAFVIFSYDSEEEFNAKKPSL